MRVSIVNLSDHTILCSSEKRRSSIRCSASPSTRTEIELPKLSAKLTLFNSGQEKNSPHVDEEEEKALLNGQYTINVKRTWGTLWNLVDLPEECPWRIYRSRLSRTHYQLLILPKRDLSSFLSEIPDSVPLSYLLLPGTHDTMAFYGWPISQCQSLSTPLSVQLHSGVRVLDVRLSVIRGRLIAYHGVYPQRTPFQHILRTVHAFLTSPQTCHEVLIMSIKQEDFKTVSAAVFSRTVKKELTESEGGLGMWFLENRVPRLGEVRGRCVMFSRFGGGGEGWEGGSEGMGIHPTDWPDSEKEGFEWQCKDTLVRTHDWYAIPSFLSIPEKVELSTRILRHSPSNADHPILSISYFSAASFPLAFPPTVARGIGWPEWGMGVEGVNSRVGRWLLGVLCGGGGDKEEGKVEEKVEKERIRGWTFMDFFKDPVGNGVMPLLVEANFRGRRGGSEVVVH